jgi:hypothetical protein
MASMPESITVNVEPYPTALEAERRQRHHEVLVAVLVECVRAANRLSIPDDESARAVRDASVQVARDYADTAYPPPLLKVAVDASLPRGEAVIVAGERELRITGLKDGVP